MRDNMKKEELFEPFRHNFDYYFYYKYIAHLENNYGIKIQDIMNYIKDNNVILEENGLIRYLFERRMFDVFNKYVDIFVNNSLLLDDLKRVIDSINFDINKKDVIYRINNRIDSDINIIVREIITKQHNYEYFKEQKILPYINRVIYEPCKEEKVRYHDIKYITSGDYSSCYRIGNKIFKMGNKRETFYIKNHRRFLQPLRREEVKSLDGDFMFCLEISEAVDMSNITNKDVYEVYKYLRDDGIIWADAKISNVGRLIFDNKIHFDGIDYVDKVGTGYLTDADYSLKKGSLVVVDNDQMYDEDEIDYIQNDNFIPFELRYQSEKNKTK